MNNSSIPGPRLWSNWRSCQLGTVPRALERESEGSPLASLFLSHRSRSTLHSGWHPSKHLILRANFILTSLGEGATTRILQKRKQAHKFSWLESRGSSGLCDAHEQHHCAQGATQETRLSCSFGSCLPMALTSPPGGGSGGYERGNAFQGLRKRKAPRQSSSELSGLWNPSSALPSGRDEGCSPRRLFSRRESHLPKKAKQRRAAEVLRHRIEKILGAHLPPSHCWGN